MKKGFWRWALEGAWVFPVVGWLYWFWKMVAEFAFVDGRLVLHSIIGMYVAVLGVGMWIGPGKIAEVGIGFVDRTGKWPRVGGVVLAGFVMLVFVPLLGPVLLGAPLSSLNVALDGGGAVTGSALIAGRRIESRGKSMAYVLELRSDSAVIESGPFEVEKSVYDRVWPGESRLRLERHEGGLGYAWYSGIKVIEHPRAAGS